MRFLHPETICRESLNPKVQGSISCASTNMLCLLARGTPHLVVAPAAVR
jgi:hypothetical protein